MCSIAGVLGGDMRVEERLRIGESMNKAMKHRGPDDSGVYSDGWLCLAHNRLSVIDPANGTQPMTREAGDGKFVLIYNGELYNTLELRRELEALGHVFRTDCDTEVLLAAYIEWGKDCLDRLNGIFAFAVYDTARRKVFLARDRLGVKPLFYAQAGGGLVFASEIKALFSHPGVKPRLGMEGLWQLVFLLPTRIPGSGVFEDVHELLPGWWMEYGENGFAAAPYWKLEACPHTDGPDETVERVRWLLGDSVERQLVSDVPLCTLLSGGLDSSAISALASSALKARGRSLDTYSFEFEGNAEHFRATRFQPESDDAYAALMAAHIDSRHTPLSASSEEIAGQLEAAVRARDLPGMGDVDSSLLHYCACIKHNHTVSVSGECADEIFGGYPWFSGVTGAPARFPWIHSLETRAALFEDAVIRRDEGIGFVNDTFRSSVAECPVIDGEDAEERALRQVGYLSIQYFMHSLLERKDRMSMASGLEIRVPFADHRLAGYVFNIPWAIKRRGGIAKAVLRDACRGVLPDAVLNRKKAPYPKTHNPRYEEIVTGMLHDRLADKSSILNTLLRRDAWGDLMEMQSVTWFGQLMAKPQLIAYLIQLDYWFRQYKVELI